MSKIIPKLEEMIKELEGITDDMNYYKVFVELVKPNLSRDIKTEVNKAIVHIEQIINLLKGGVRIYDGF